MKRLFLNNIYLFGFLLCLSSCTEKTIKNKTTESKLNKIQLEIKNLIFNDSFISNDGFIYGICNIKPQNDSTYIAVSNYDIDNDTLFKDLWQKLPILLNGKLIQAHFIDYCPSIVCGGSNKRNWLRLKLHKDNLFYFGGIYSLDAPTQDTLYFDLPFKINNKEIDKVFKFHNGYLKSNEFPHMTYTINYKKSPNYKVKPKFLLE